MNVRDVLAEFDIPDTELNREVLAARIERDGLDAARATLRSVHRSRWVMNGNQANREDRG